MLSLGGERLPPSPFKKKVLDHYLHHDLGMLQLLLCFFAHVLILEYPDHHQNLISSSLYYPGPLHKISSQSVHNFLSNVVHRQTDRQTNQCYQKHKLEELVQTSLAETDHYSHIAPPSLPPLPPSKKNAQCKTVELSGERLRFGINTYTTIASPSASL